MSLQSFYCRAIGPEAFAAYKEKLTKLCKEENISYKIVTTPTSKYSSTVGPSSTYPVVPGFIESGKHLLQTHITFVSLLQ